jgi:hypothetical protein
MQIQTLLDAYGAVKLNTLPDWVVKAALRHAGKRLPAAEIAEALAIRDSLPEESTVEQFLLLPRVQELITVTGEKLVAAFSTRCACGGEFEADYCVVCMNVRP